VKGENEHKKSLLIWGSLEKEADRLKNIVEKEFPDYTVKIQSEVISNNKDAHEQKIEMEKKDSVNEYISSYQFLFDQNPNALFLVDFLNQKYLDANASALKLTGRSLEELKELSTSDINLQIAIDRIQELKNNELKDGELLEYVQPDGTLRIARLDVLQFRDDLYWVIARDVTDVVLTKTRLKERDRVYKTLIDNLPGFVYQCKNDEYWTIMFITKTCETITGYKPEELVNNQQANFEELIIGEYKELTRAKMEEALENKSRFDFRYPIKTKDNKVKWVRERSVGVFDEEGELTHIEGFVTDITEAVRYEQIQKALLQISSSVIKSSDNEQLISVIKEELGHVIDTTNFYIALYDPETDTFSLPYFKDQKDRITQLPAGKTMTKYVVESQKSLLANVELKRKLVEEGKIELKGSLSKIWLGVPLKVRDEIVGVLAVQSYDDAQAYNESDLHLLEFASDQIGLFIQIKRKEEELKNALLKAEEADRLKTSFLANMSHEIRTPMNGILGFTQVLREEDLTLEERMQFLSIIEKSGNRMLNIINDLIDVSKVDAGLVDVNITGVDVYEVTNYLYNFFKPEVEKKGIGFELKHNDTSKSFLVQTDGEKLYAILTNLIKNAIKYSNEGKIEYGYSYKSGDLTFYVKDTGVGIPEDKKKEVFSRFVQLNKSTDPFLEGSGLGLSIVKAYVELLGGEIWFESKENIGTTFFFNLPTEPN
jgi:PAS domain S-box-containing protein